MFAMKCGISASSSSGSPAELRPSAIGNCLAMMMMPIDASRPCTAALGKNSPRTPARQHAEQDLDHAGGDADTQSQPVGLQVGRGIAAAGEAELGHAADRDDDQARRRALDRQLGIADRAAEDAADDRREDARRSPGSRRPGRSPGTAAAQSGRPESPTAHRPSTSGEVRPEYRAGRRLDPPPLPGLSAARLTSCRHRTGGGDGTPQHTQRTFFSAAGALNQSVEGLGGTRGSPGRAGRAEELVLGALRVGRISTSTARRSSRFDGRCFQFADNALRDVLEVDGTPTGVRGFEPDLTLAFRLGDFGRPRPEARAAGPQGDDEKKQQGMKAPPTKRRRQERRQGAHTRRRNQGQHGGGLEYHTGRRPVNCRAGDNRRHVADQQSNRREPDRGTRGLPMQSPGGPTSSARTGGRRASTRDPDRGAR